jgi:coenzyme PQQ precursor peptide PqqA
LRLAAQLTRGLHSFWRTHMQEWHKPEVAEQEVGLEVTSYLPAEV